MFRAIPAFLICAFMCSPLAARLEAGVLSNDVLSKADSKIQAVKLFVIERNKNANIVEYIANVDRAGNIEKAEPIHAYWKLLAENGRTQELNLFEQKAYGFNCNFDSVTGEYQLEINSFKQRRITVYKDQDTVRAETIISGKPGFLEKVYIRAEQGAFVPVVKYIELYGKDKISGEPLYEKIEI